jgi:hypothetical protein
MIDVSESVDNVTVILMQCAEDAIIKSDVTAELYETEAQRSLYETYRLCYFNIDAVGDHSYTYDEMVAAGLGTTEIAYAEVGDFYKLADIYTTALLANKRTSIINSYSETNRYYRQLNGLPTDDDPTFKVSDYGTFGGIDGDLYIHECSSSEISVLDNKGIIDDLISTYPTAVYLKYVTRRVDFISAREASDYDLLSTTTTTDENEYIVNLFKNNYELEKNYFSRTFVNRFYTEMYDFYVQTMQFYLIMATIIRSMKTNILSHIDGDVIDEITIQKIMESHGMTYYSSMPRSLKLTIIKNMNYLLSYRGSKQVLIDIQEIFEIDNIYRYVLYKRRNAGGGMDDSDHTLVFVKVPISEKNPRPYLLSATEHLPYASVISEDEYWADDDSLYDEILAKKFNYVNTKYISLENMVNLSEFTYDLTYFLRMILNNKEGMNFNVLLRSTGYDVNLYDLIIYTLALICYRYNYTGEILDSSDEIVSVLGFNSPDNMAEIKSIMESIFNSYILDDYNVATTYGTIDAFLTDYKNNRLVIDNLTTLLSEETDNYKYNQLLKVRKALLLTPTVKANFMKSDGEVASTFEEKVYDSSLSSRYEYIKSLADDDETDDELDDIISSLEQAFPSLVNSYLFNGLNRSQTTYVFENFLSKIISFFKSYRTQLKEFESIFILDDKHLDRIAVLEDIDLQLNLAKYLRVIIQDNTYFEIIKQYDSTITFHESAIEDKETASINIWDNGINYLN